MRGRNARVRILTNSLESATALVAHAGYTHFRVALLEDGVDLYEVRSLLGNASGSGQTAKLSRYGNYSLHAKLIVFDRQKLFIGSMNFDQRSKRLNTEIGLIIDSPELAQQTATRFEGMTQLANSYTLALRARVPGDRPRLVWDTQENGVPVEYDHEPARSGWQRLKMHLYALLPVSSEL
jgi:putative cardiolipin synthase